jgi:hypothetical protein
LKIANFDHRFGKPPQICSNSPSNQAIVRNGPPNFGKAGRARRRAGGYDVRHEFAKIETMSPDSFFHSAIESAAAPASDGCQSCPRGGFCGARIHPDCLRIDPGGTVRVSLAAAATAWFETLARLGETLHLTRNRVAVLGRLEQFPALTDWRNPLMPRDDSDLFTPNLAEYAGLWAVREMTPLGVRHGLEARDVSGAVFERVLLPDGAAREVFEAFVTDHQSPPEATSPWFPPNHAWSAQRRNNLSGRIPWLRDRLAAGAVNVRQLPTEFVAKLLAAAAQENFPVRTTHYHPALIRAAIWTPQIGEETERNGNLPDFFQGDSVGLQLNHSAAGSAWLWTGTCSCCDEQHLTVELADANDQIGLSVIAAHKTLKAGWCDLLNLCLT